MPEFNIVATNEILPDIAKSYKLNHPTANILTYDIADITEEMLQKATNGQKIDLIIDGPPCQSYSTLEKRQMDDRAEPYNEFLKFVRKKRQNHAH